MEFNRGDIVIVNLYPKKGDEVGKNTGFSPIFLF